MTYSSKHFKRVIGLTGANIYLRNMVIMCALGILMCNIYNVFLEKIFNTVFLVCRKSNEEFKGTMKPEIKLGKKRRKYNLICISK